MASQKQLNANRLNANKSTGPRTPEGKSITRLNAVKHALTGQLTLIEASQYTAYAAVERRMLASMQPSGEQEIQVAVRIIRDTWRLSRAAANEDNIFALGLLENSNDMILTENGDPTEDAHLTAVITDARTAFDTRRDAALLSMYEHRLKRGLHKDYQLFQQLQRERKREENKQASTYYARPHTGNAGLSAAASTPAAPIGSVSTVFSGAPVSRPAYAQTEPQIVDSTHPYVPPAGKMPVPPPLQPFWPC